MAPRKALANGDIAVPLATKPAPGSRLPAPVRFPLFVLLSLTMSWALYTVVGEVTQSESATVSRTPNETVLTSVLVWRFILLGIGWFGKFDGKYTPTTTFSDRMQCAICVI